MTAASVVCETSHSLESFDVMLTDYISFIGTIHQELQEFEQCVLDETNSQVERAKATDKAMKVKQMMDKLTNKINLVEQSTKCAKKVCDNIIDVQRRKLQEQLAQLNTNEKAFISNEVVSTDWADIPADIDPIENNAWATVASKKSTQPKVKNVQSQNYAFSVSTRKEGNTTWYNMIVPVKDVYLDADINNDNSVAIPAIHVKSDRELSKLPPGMLVMHTGNTVPKFHMTTSHKHNPSVPLSCRMYNYEDEDTATKYARFDSTLSNSAEVPQDMSRYYNDAINAKRFGIEEDQSRVFRLHKLNHCHGIGVYNNKQFGDAKMLRSQLKSTNLDATFDLYQYSLWMMLVSIAHHRNKKFK